MFQRGCGSRGLSAIGLLAELGQLSQPGQLGQPGLLSRGELIGHAERADEQAVHLRQLIGDLGSQLGGRGHLSRDL